MRAEIIDLKIGNVGSVANMLRHIGLAPHVISEPSLSSKPDWLILPGIGAFDHGMQRLKESGFDKLLLQSSESTRILGICLGMQLLCESSEEGELEGLSLIPGHFIRFGDFNETGLRVPHMGWNETKFTPQENIADGFEVPFRFYFVHSYRYKHRDDTHVWAHAIYGERFVAAIRSKNAFGVQFHPEKSHQYGISFFQKLFQS